MGRFKSLASATGAPIPANASSPVGDSSLPWRPDVEPEHRVLYEKLVADPEGYDVPDPVVLAMAAAMVVFVPAGTWVSQRRRCRLLCLLLDYDRTIHGDLDLRRALRRASFEEFIKFGTAAKTPHSLQQYATELTRYGKELHPYEYPSPPPPRVAPRHKGTATDAEVRAIYRAKAAAGPIYGPRLEQVVDLVTGVGAHSGEIALLTGSSVTVRTHGGRERVCVDLVSPRTGAIRTVPFYDPLKGARVRARAEAIHPDDFLVEGSRRDVVSGIQTNLRGRGITTRVPAVELRNWWVLQMCQLPIPAVTLMQMAAIGNSRALWEITHHLPEQDAVAAIDLCREVTR